MHRPRRLLRLVLSGVPRGGAAHDRGAGWDLRLGHRLAPRHRRAGEPVGVTRLERGEGSSCEAAPEGSRRGVLSVARSRSPGSPNSLASPPASPRTARAGCRGTPYLRRWALLIALAAAHQVDEAVEQVVRIVRAGGGLRVVLHREDRQLPVSHALRGPVV